MPKPLLDLSTLERPTICIDKVNYPLMRPEDFGLRESVRIERLRREVAGVMVKSEDGLGEEDVLAMAGALDELVHLILPDVDPETFARLRDGQKLALLEAFSRLATPEAQATPTATQSQAENRSTGASGCHG